ncbi:E3 SUMO-protein ligase ZBED1-like [Styela clava]
MISARRQWLWIPDINCGDFVLWSHFSSKVQSNWNSVLFEQTVVEKAEPSSSSVQQSTSIISLAFESSESDDSADTEVPVVANEVNKFFSSTVLSECSNPLTWWKEQNANYPNLSKLVGKYMCVTATSTPSERLFSAAGNTATELRSSLTGSHVQALVFLKCNSDI